MNLQTDNDMKRVLLFFSLMLIIGTSNTYSQMPVKDKGKWSVLNNMEFMDRVRLQPEWYHYWIWYKKVLGIKIPLPGLGLHDLLEVIKMQNEINELRKNGKLTPEDTIRIKNLYNKLNK